MYIYEKIFQLYICEALHMLLKHFEFCFYWKRRNSVQNSSKTCLKWTFAIMFLSVTSTTCLEWQKRMDERQEVLCHWCEAECRLKRDWLLLIAEIFLGLFSEFKFCVTTRTNFARKKRRTQRGKRNERICCQRITVTKPKTTTQGHVRPQGEALFRLFQRLMLMLQIAEPIELGDLQHQHQSLKQSE